MSGMPTKYKPEFDEQVKKLSLLGAIDTEIADFFGVCETTLNKWKKAHKSFREAMMSGKIIADANVAERLYERAMGVKIKNQKALVDRFGTPHVVNVEEEIAPDVNAQRFWLNNRNPKRWRDKQTLDIDFSKFSDDQLDEIINTLMQKQNGSTT
jgi:transposase-like protein